ncbi:MAG: hypothetical protein N2203_05950 [Bacteroidia bacterium]|nr:hypothetical protein [Bacteroidia bacterium]
MEETKKIVFEMIEKEKIADLKFPDEDVIKDEEMRKQRLRDLERATTLGNLDKIKFKIYFADDKSHKYTETTIWGLTDKRVILKQGIMIPISRIFEIKY